MNIQSMETMRLVATEQIKSQKADQHLVVLSFLR